TVAVRRPGLTARARRSFSDLSVGTTAALTAESLFLVGGDPAKKRLTVTAGERRAAAPRTLDAPLPRRLPARALALPAPGPGGRGGGAGGGGGVWGREPAHARRQGRSGGARRVPRPGPPRHPAGGAPAGQPGALPHLLAPAPRRPAPHRLRAGRDERRYAV